MQGTVDGFSYGLVTPVAAFLVACLGAALGLRCTACSLRRPHSWKPGRLALGAAAIGSGAWSMHFIAMMGFVVSETPVGYDRPTMLAALGLGIVMIGTGIFIVGYRGTTPMALLTGGTVTGLGIATMHYLGMAGVRLRGHVEYDTVTVALSVLIAVAAATAALWTVVSHRGPTSSLAGGLVMGVAATGMHYTGMAAADVRLDPAAAAGAAGRPNAAVLLPMLIAPAVFLLLAGVAVLFDPLMSGGSGGSGGSAGRERVRATVAGVRSGVPTQRTRTRLPHRSAADRDGAAARPEGRGSPDFHDW
jgi:NO-binding membrane sensor protein with MHYT domain